TIPRHGYRERPVQLAHYTIRGGMELPATLKAVALQRRGLWHHSVRNRKLSHLAAAFTGNDRDAIKAMLGQSVVAAIAPAVVVLAANLEHALVLAERLPGWQLIVGSHANEDGLTPSQVQRLHERPSPFPVGPLHAIATPAGLAELDLSLIDVLIRAD